MGANLVHPDIPPSVAPHHAHAGTPTAARLVPGAPGGHPVTSVPSEGLWVMQTAAERARVLEHDYDLPDEKEMGRGACGGGGELLC